MLDTSTPDRGQIDRWQVAMASQHSQQPAAHVHSAQHKHLPACTMHQAPALASCHACLVSPLCYLNTGQRTEGSRDGMPVAGAPFNRRVLPYLERMSARGRQ
jgi:hypothetical protein